MCRRNWLLTTRKTYARGKTGRKQTGRARYAKRSGTARIPYTGLVHRVLQEDFLPVSAHMRCLCHMAFRIAWSVINYPLAFYAAYFSVRASGKFDGKAILLGPAGTTQVGTISLRAKRAPWRRPATHIEVAMETKLRGFSDSRQYPQRSDVQNFLIEDGMLLPPLSSVPGLGRDRCGRNCRGASRSSPLPRKKTGSGKSQPKHHRHPRRTRRCCKACRKRNNQPVRDVMHGERVLQYYLYCPISRT